MSPSSFSSAFRALSWAKVQPPSPTGPTYAKAIFSGPLAGVATAEAATEVVVVVVVVVPAGVAVVVVFSSLLQPASAATSASELQPASWTKDRFESRVMGAPVNERGDPSRGESGIIAKR